jgi:hypothetical protein
MGVIIFSLPKKSKKKLNLEISKVMKISTEQLESELLSRKKCEFKKTPHCKGFSET